MIEPAHCRACFEFIDPNETRNLCNLQTSYKIQNCDVTFAQILSELTGVCLKGNKMELICVSCKESLISFYSFKQKVVDTDRKFKELMTETGTEVIEVMLKEEMKMEIDVEHTQLPRVQSCKRRLQKKYNMTPEGLYVCPKENCPGLFKKRGRLEIHLRNIHPETDQTTFPCETCDEKFPTLLLLKQHNYKFHTPRPYICDICGNNYPILGSLRLHMMKIHVKGKQPEKIRQACPICGKVFASQGNMLRHRKEFHFPKELVPKPFICNVCGSNWTTKSKLVAHMKYHAAPQFTCDLCGKKFCFKGTLVQHKQLVHMDIRPFFCDICGKKFKTKHQLQNHQSIHTDERPFKCPKCPATFKLKDSLYEHETKTHTSSGPLACYICGKLYKVKSTLRVHMAQHNGKDLKCPHCDVTYKDKTSLRFHVRTIHLGFKKRHACPICMINLSSRKQIVEHLKQTHQSVLIAANRKPEELVQSYWTNDPSGADIGEKPPVVSFVKSE